MQSDYFCGFCYGGFPFFSGSEIPANLDHSLADTSKPTIVVDPVTNEEVLLGELKGCDQGPI